MNSPIDSSTIEARVAELFLDHGFDFAAAVPGAPGQPVAFGVGRGTWQALVDAVGATVAGPLADRCGDGPFLPVEETRHQVKQILDEDGNILVFLFKR